MAAAKKTRAEIIARVRTLLAKATDPGAPEEERRTSASIAAKLMREHGIGIGEPAPAAAPPVEPLQPQTRARVNVVVNGVRTMVDVASQGLGFDVGSFVQDLLRDRVQGALRDAVQPVRPRARTRRK